MASNHSAPIVQRLWNYCDVLRDDGVSYGDYVEQLTYLLFLKMADEQARLPAYARGPGAAIPAGLDWLSLRAREGDDLGLHYRHLLESLGREKGLLGVIFAKAQNKIQDPAKLRRLILLIDEQEWSSIDADVKGDIYEGLLQKNAEDVKSGAGQYFTPRPLIRAMVACVRPALGQTVCDPACGTGGFLLAVHDYLVGHNRFMDRDQARFLRHDTFEGVDLVGPVVRLCVMNLFLHGIGGDDGDVDIAPIREGDALASDPGVRYDLVLTNPPFGRKSSITVYNGEGQAKRETISYERDDFWTTTSNKQLNFLQHVKTVLKINGRAAIVVPDNVLFEGGAGETVRRRLLAQYDVHTLLRLPTGIFYAQGVKANVLFFDRKPAREQPWTERVWVYDLRTNQHFTLKQNPLDDGALEDFVRCYNPANRHDRQETERFHAFAYDELLQRDKVSLDVFWLKDESLEDVDSLPAPEALAVDIVENLQAALEQFQGILEELGEE
jgi:type I restriction enzyme M protein